jgi:hypothetical protein
MTPLFAPTDAGALFDDENGSIDSSAGENFPALDGRQAARTLNLN